MSVCKWIICTLKNSNKRFKNCTYEDDDYGEIAEWVGGFVNNVGWCFKTF